MEGVQACSLNEQDHRMGLAAGLDRAEAAFRSSTAVPGLGLSPLLSGACPCVVLPAGATGGCSGPTPCTASELADLSSSPDSVFPLVHQEGIGGGLAVPCLAPAELLHGFELLSSSPTFCGSGACRAAWQ